MNDVETLIEMHRYKRPASSDTELEFIQNFIVPLGAKRDRSENYWVIVGDPDVMWSCHTDTVHHTGGRQKLRFDGTWLKLHEKSQSTCLGADCTAGVWIMSEMIKAGVPGLYVFHAEEESGGWGSTQFAKDNAAYLKGFKAAVAFDRKGESSVITHMWERTCSDAFADSLIAQLPGYKRDETGSFTDTKNYIDIIPECTNISVGYVSAHSYQESLNVPHLIKLRDTMLTIDTSRFVISRDPKAKPEYRSTSYKPLAEPTTITGLVWRNTSVAARVMEKLMSFEEFKTLFDAAKDEMDAEWNRAFEADQAAKAYSATDDLEDDQSWRGRTYATHATGTRTPTSGTSTLYDLKTGTAYRARRKIRV